MKPDMKDIASLLDETIEKGLSLVKKTKIERIEEDLIKGFSHDVMNPISVNQFSEYHNPYQWADNGFLPLPADVLKETYRTTDPSAYLQNQIFYDKYINYRRSLAALEQSVGEDLVKAGAVPIGAVHQFKDGQTYRKDQTGWKPHSEKPALSDALMSDDPNHQAEANAHIEDHAKKTIAHTSEAKRRMNRKNELEQFKQQFMKEVVQQVTENVEKFLDGPLPSSAKEYLKGLSGDDNGKQAAN